MTREKAPLVLLTALFAAFIIILPRYTDAAKTWFALLILAGVIYVLTHPRDLRRVDATERLFIFALLANFLWMAFSFYYNGEPGRGASYLWDRHFYFLFLIPMFFMFRHIRIPWPLIVLCLVISALFSFADILIDILQRENYRKQGMNMNKFGPIQLCITGLLACCLPCLDKTWKKLLVGAAIFAGFATVVLSQSKAAWLAAVVVLVFFIMYLPTRWSSARKLGALLMVLIVLASSYSLPVVKKRINKLYKNIAAYVDSDHHLDKKRKGTFGTRMDLWKSGWFIFREQPVTGAGLGAFRVKMKQNMDSYQISAHVANYKYVHNQYLTALVTRGIPGLILMLLVMCIPIYIAMKHKTEDCESNSLRLGLLLIGITYLVVNLPDDHFEGKSANMFLSVMLALLLARLSSSQQQRGSTTPKAA